jgi:hypothetical protein
VIPSVIAENMTRGQTGMAQPNRLSPTDLPRFRVTITRSIVESHGGRLWAANNSARGASVHITFPTTIEANESAGGRSHGLHH